MSDAPQQSAAPLNQKQNVLQSFLSHLLTMPGLHKKILAGAMLLGGAGTAGRVAAFLAPSPETSQSAPAQVQTDATARSVVNGTSTAAPVESPAPAPTLNERISPLAQKLGFGFIAGFVIGWAFRAFVKIMSVVSVVGVAILAGLAYFNVDTSGLKTKFQSGTEWVTDQGEQMAKKLATHLPSSAAGITGLGFGFKRKK